MYRLNYFPKYASAGGDDGFGRRQGQKEKSGCMI